jgi:peptide-methionine (S)-S-oxide reductase
MKVQKAIFAAGCFWGVESNFRKVEGVISTRVGYIGGEFKNPTYNAVCSLNTGHAEAIEITFDPSKVSYNELLDVFWTIHDPTTLNRQGPDIGSQYRSAIFYIDSEQKEIALNSKAKLEAENRFKRPIVTQIVPASEFWEAEEYHQQYNERRKGRFIEIGY